MAYFTEKKIAETADEVTFNWIWTSSQGSAHESQNPTEVIDFLTDLEKNKNGDAVSDLSLKKIMFSTHLPHNSNGTPYHSATTAVYLMGANTANNYNILFKINGAQIGELDFEKYGGLITLKNHVLKINPNVATQNKLFIACGGEFSTSNLNLIGSSSWDQIARGGGYNIIATFKKFYA